LTIFASYFLMSYNPNVDHRRSIRLNGYDYSHAGSYFITLCCHQRNHLFGATVPGNQPPPNHPSTTRPSNHPPPNHPPPSPPPNLRPSTMPADRHACTMMPVTNQRE